MIKRSEFDIGEFLTTAEGRTFIHNGYIIDNGGYCAVIGMTGPTEVFKSENYYSLVYYGKMRKATEEEKDRLITRIMYNPIIMDY